VIFLDTGFLLALVSQRDENHERAREVLEDYRDRSLWDQTLTTDHVVSETITAVRFKAEPNNLPKGHALAVEVGRGLYDGAFGKIYQVTAQDEHDAFEYFARYRDKTYSFVDCLSFVVMDKLGLREALSVDDDFTHRFIARPGPRRK
jgi:predicted nucleic acid-binding protein